MHPLSWLTSHRFESLTKREHEWVFVFQPDVQLVVPSMWRLLEQGRVRFTSCDDGQWFGLPSPVDASAEINCRISGELPVSVELRDGTLDLDIHFAGERVLQIIPDSAGYEAWQLYGNNKSFIAIGGGTLRIIDRPAFDEGM